METWHSVYESRFHKIGGTEQHKRWSKEMAAEFGPGQLPNDKEIIQAIRILDHEKSKRESAGEKVYAPRPLEIANCIKNVRSGNYDKEALKERRYENFFESMKRQLRGCDGDCVKAFDILCQPSKYAENISRDTTKNECEDLEKWMFMNLSWYKRPDVEETYPGWHEAWAKIDSVNTTAARMGVKDELDRALIPKREEYAKRARDNA